MVPDHLNPCTFLRVADTCKHQQLRLPILSSSPINLSFQKRIERSVCQLFTFIRKEGQSKAIPTAGAKMDPKTGDLPSANIPPRLQFQSMEQFDRECEQREAAEKVKKESPKKVKGPPPAKKQKKTEDPNAAAAKKVAWEAEEAALKEMGQTNWIGKLNGQLQLPQSLASF